MIKMKSTGYALLSRLWLRVGELTNHTWEAFRPIDGHWWFIVKGNKRGKIPVHPQLLDLVTHFRVHLRLTPLPQASDNFPLVLSWRSPNGLTARHINYLLKDLALQTAKTHFKDNPVLQVKLKKFSVH